ncbi:hypothetical protein [Dyadobacter sp. NIV53]|uniref:hypothetical protein n=1 Tax=Dyadobacter sp. NIV53 TaxID=2861765 RepID=UPI001C8884BE|nr:hypothetical protein [Dyadobacter sp. NIV53]
MKSKILLSALLLMLSGSVFAQTDSTAVTPATKKYTSGFAVFAEFGLLSNNSFTDMRKQLKLLGTEPFGSLMSSIVLAKRMESDRWISEHRLILMNSTKPNNEVDKKRASLWGVGLGFNFGPKLVNTPKWNVFIPIGVDAMFYKLGIKSNYSASLTKVISSPASYQAVKLYTGSLNLNAGIGVDYKTGIMPKHFDKFYISSKLAYHLPVVTTGQWRGENVQVTDVDTFKPNQLYLSIGIVMTPKSKHGKWGGMN